MQVFPLVGWDVLGLERFGACTFWVWDVLKAGPYVVGRFVFGHFVGVPLKYVLTNK